MIGYSKRFIFTFEKAKKNVVNMIGYSKRFIFTFEKAKEILSSGILGDLIYFNSTMYVSQLFSTGKGWRYKKTASGGGVLNTLAAHLVDLLLWFFGEVSFVQGHTKSFYSPEVEDFVHAYLKFESGLEGYLDSSWSVRNYRLPEIKIEIQGENGMLSVTEEHLKYYIDSEGRWYSFSKQDLYHGVDFDLGGPEYTLEDKHFVESVKNNNATSVGVYDGYKAQKLIEAIYLSSSRKSIMSGEEL
jgi:predicted dehydrogenase